MSCDLDKDIVNECIEDLRRRFKDIVDVDSAFVYSVDELLTPPQGGFQYPFYGLTFIGAVPKANEGRTFTIRVAIYVVDGPEAFHFNKIVDPCDSIALLAKLRHAIRGQKSPTGKLWEWAGELPDQIGERFGYYQQWETTSTMG